MCASRMALAVVLIACLGAGSLYDIVTGREHWPFSPYPMFAAIDQNRTLSVLRLVGVTAEDTPREIPLLDSRLIAPFDQCRLSTALSRTYFSARRPLIHEMLRDSLERYDALRIAGEHDQPPLGAVRLYEMRWTLDPAGRNVATPDERPKATTGVG